MDTTSHSRSRGHSGSYSTSEQQAARDLLTPDEVRLLPDGKAVLFVRGERPVIDDKYDLLRHPCIRFTEDGGAPPYDYTTATQAADDLPGDAGDWELLDMDDFLPQHKPPKLSFQTIQTQNRRRSAHEPQKPKPTE